MKQIEDEYVANHVYYGMVTHESLQNIEGKALTMIDAAIQDKEQRKAVKDLFRRMFWFDWVSNDVWKGPSPMPVGMPIIRNKSL